MFLRGEQDVEFCMAVSTEWHQSHHYWGAEDSIIIQILPLYHVVESKFISVIIFCFLKCIQFYG